MILRKVFLSIIIFFVSFTFYTALVLFLFKWIDPPTTSFIQQEKERSLHSVLERNKVNQIWMPLTNISNEIKLAVLTSEDQRFFEHLGFDVKQINRAIEDFERGKKLRGASTITQQVAKNLFLYNDKSWMRKVLETYYTVMIELIWSKKRILEVYLNIAEFGKKLYGVEAASSYYFNKSAAYLNSKEGALLISILPNPKKYIINSPSSYLLKRTNRILEEKKSLNSKKILEELN